jgi:hypothetical protein
VWRYSKGGILLESSVGSIILSSWLLLVKMSEYYLMTYLSVTSFCFICFIVVLGAHCGIYKSSYNISNISYWIHSLHHSPLSPSLHSWNSFNRSHFSIYIHMYTVFAPNSPPHALSPHPPSPSHANPTDTICSALLFSDCKRKKKRTSFFISSATMMGESQGNHGWWCILLDLHLL